MLFIGLRGRPAATDESRRFETVVLFAELRGACHDVVVAIKGVNAQSVSDAQFNPGARHDLHQPKSAFRR